MASGLGVVPLGTEQGGRDIQDSSGDAGDCGGLLAEEIDILDSCWLFEEQPSDDVFVLTSRAVLDAAVVSDVVQFERDTAVWRDSSSFLVKTHSGFEYRVGELGVVWDGTGCLRASLVFDGDLVMTSDGDRLLGVLIVEGLHQIGSKVEES